MKRLKSRKGSKTWQNSKFMLKILKSEENSKFLSEVTLTPYRGGFFGILRQWKYIEFVEGDIWYLNLE